jgi:hypothetical protein
MLHLVAGDTGKPPLVAWGSGFIPAFAAIIAPKTGCKRIFSGFSAAIEASHCGY